MNWDEYFEMHKQLGDINSLEDYFRCSLRWMIDFDKTPDDMETKSTKRKRDRVKKIIIRRNA